MILRSAKLTVLSLTLFGLVSVLGEGLAGRFDYLSDLTMENPAEKAAALYNEGRWRDVQEYVAFYRALPGTASVAEALKPIDEAAGEERAKAVYQARELAKGFLTGESEELYGQAAGVASDLMVVGDVRDLLRAGAALTEGREPDPLITALAAAGLAMTVAGWYAAGSPAAVSVKAGASVLKTAKRTGRLSLTLEKDIIRLSKSTDGLRTLAEGLGTVADFGRTAGPDGAFALLARAAKVSDLRRTADIARGFGKNAGRMLRWGGPDVVTATEKAGARAVSRAAVYGERAVSRLTMVRAERLLPDLARLSKAGTRTMIRTVKRISGVLAPLFFFLSAGFTAVTASLGLVGLCRRAWRAVNCRKAKVSS